MLLSIIAYADIQFFGIKTDTDIVGVWINFSTAIFLAVTIGVLVYTTILQRKAIEIDEYENLRERHQDLITFQIENKETLQIFNEVKIPQKYRDAEKDKEPLHDYLVTIDDNKITLDEQENLIFQFYVAEFDLYERVWFLKEEKEELTEYEWICWIIYMEKMSHHWIFRYTFNQTRTIFDIGFMDYIKAKIMERQDRNENAREELVKDAQIEYEKEYGKKLVFSDIVGYRK